MTVRAEPTIARIRQRSRLSLAAFFVLLLGCSKFERKHIAVEHVAELGYPACPEGGRRVIAAGHLRSGPTHIDPNIVERYSLEDRGCNYAMIVRQEWPGGTADVEVLYDRSFKALRIWKQMTSPAAKRGQVVSEVRRYELRTQPVEMKRRRHDGTLDYEQILGGAPSVVIGPGRGLLSVWIRHAKLKVGEKTHAQVIDVRGLEKIERAALQREDDLSDATLGGRVQVYTFFGRETVFADASGNVLGDLAGMRPHALLSTPAPPSIPLLAPLDPKLP
jgi:hypothetical protein